MKVNIVKLYLSNILVLVVLVILSGCTMTRPLESIPTTEEDFLLPPNDIIKKFSDIKEYHPAYMKGGLARPGLLELEKAWGKADYLKKDWVHYVGLPIVLGGLASFVIGVIDPYMVGLVLVSGV